MHAATYLEEHLPKALCRIAGRELGDLSPPLR